jgi:opacity protein-like surface antigen
MKKCVLILSFLIMTIGLSAQVYVGGNVSFSATAEDQTVDNTTTEISRTTSFSILPEAGYFLASDLAVGGKAGVSLQRQNTNPGGDDNISSLLRFHISPYVRKYFSLGDKLYLYGEGGVNFATGTVKNTVAGTTSDGNTITDFSIAVAPGMEYKISDRFAVSLHLGSLGYEISKTTTPGNPETITKNKRFYFNAGLSNLSFGLKYYLNMGASTSE